MPVAPVVIPMMYEPRLLYVSILLVTILRSSGNQCALRVLLSTRLRAMTYQLQLQIRKLPKNCIASNGSSLV